MTVLELYDATPRDISLESVILGRLQHPARTSSYTSVQLEVRGGGDYGLRRRGGGGGGHYRLLRLIQQLHISTTGGKGGSAWHMPGDFEDPKEG